MLRKGSSSINSASASTSLNALKYASPETVNGQYSQVSTWFKEAADKDTLPVDVIWLTTIRVS